MFFFKSRDGISLQICASWVAQQIGDINVYYLFLKFYLLGSSE